MKSNRKTAIVLICVVAFIAVQGAAAKSFYPADGQTEFSLEEVYYLNSAMLNSDMLQFLQAYINPDDPLSFYREAAEWTDEEIETNAFYYLSFVYAEIAGKIPFYYFSNIEEYIKVTAQDVGQGPFGFSENITSFDDLRAIYPSGIVYCNPYDMLRTTARQLVYYILLHSEDGRSPSADVASEILDQIFAYLEQQYEEAMESEAAALEVYSESEAEGEAAPETDGADSTPAI